MAVNELEICNAALSRLGAPPITSLSGSDKRSVACSLNYSRIRDSLLRSHPWNFAIKRVELNDSGIVPAFEFSNSFILPSDFLKALRLETSDEEYRLESGYLLCNNSTAKLLYVARVTDTTKFDPMFDVALELMLASTISYSLVQSVSLKTSLMEELNIVLRDVRSANAQEGTPYNFEFNEWLESRL